MGGPKNLENFRITKTRRKFFSPKPNPFSCPKLGEDPKKRSSLKFNPVFGPKLGEDQKKRSSPIVSVLKPSAQVTKGETMLQFCILFYANYIILVTQRGGPWPNAPPKYAPVLKDRKFGLNFLNQCVFKFKKLVIGTEFQNSFH